MITFIKTKTFLRQWEKLGLTGEELKTLVEEELKKAPERWDIIPGTGGLRKMRIAIKGRGKSGGARVLYVTFLFYEVIVLADVYAKNRQENITEQDKRAYKVLIKAIKQALSEGGKGK